MAVYFISKDKKFRFKRALNELSILRLKFFLNLAGIGVVDKQKINFLFVKSLTKVLPYSVRSNNRCVITSRSGSVFRFFRLSRITLKNFASTGALTGIRKSS